MIDVKFVTSYWKGGGWVSQGDWTRVPLPVSLSQFTIDRWFGSLWVAKLEGSSIDTLLLQIGP
jgi:hypothetical protein